MTRRRVHRAPATGLSLALLCFLIGSAYAAEPDYPGASSYTQGIHYTTRTGRTITYIVIHTIEGSATGAISWFKHPSSKVSAHYVVSHGGVVTQIIREKDKAWHAGNASYNEHSIGIENEGYAGKDHWTDTQYKTLAKLTAYLCAKYSIPIDCAHLIAHKEVPGATHTDPGPFFKWDYFMHLVRTSGTGFSTPAPTPTPTPAPVPTTSAVKTLKVTTSSLNVRSSAWGSILGSTAYGKIHASDSASGDWSKIYWGGRTAYVSTGYTTATTDHAVKVTAGTLNVRSSASSASSANLLGTASSGQSYTELSRTGTWIYIQYDSRKAWISASYATRLK